VEKLQYYSEPSVGELQYYFEPYGGSYSIRCVLHGGLQYYPEPTAKEIQYKVCTPEASVGSYSKSRILFVDFFILWS